MKIIGLNAFHADASAALTVNGKVVAAAEEERFTRIKHWAGIPIDSIRTCLKTAGMGVRDIDYWAINTDGRAQRSYKFRYMLSGMPRPGLIYSRIRNRASRGNIEQKLREVFDIDRKDFALHAVEHHLSHLASSFYPSGFDRALALSVDGFGDFSSAAWGVGSETGLDIDGFVRFPHSLGIFYQALTQYLGFRSYGDEYKVMGLAPYGNPTFIRQMEDIVSMEHPPRYRLNLDYFRHHRHSISTSWDQGSPEFGSLYSPLMETTLGPARDRGEDITQRHMDIAASVQELYEQCFFRMLDALYDRYQMPFLTLAGGCAMNSVANGKILHRTKFKKVFVQPAAGDAGGALGAALELNRRLTGTIDPDPMPDAYLGPSFSCGEIKALIDAQKSRLETTGCRTSCLDWDSLIVKIVEALIAGKVVGWFQGRMEWGARALGNRSIICDPRREDMRTILNLKIKRRESFRPFAPSILREHVMHWFEIDDDVPYMQKVYKIQKHRKPQIPAVTHIDGSGRLQTVTEKQNPLYYRLISVFFEHTGVPLLLNTSFNENEPIVCKPEEALDCFVRTEIDVLAMENMLITRNSG